MKTSFNTSSVSTVMFLCLCLSISGCFEEKVKVIEYSHSSYKGQYFGFSVSISGDYAATGIPEAYNIYDFKTGAVIVSERSTMGWLANPHNSSPENLDNGDSYGFAVAINGDDLIVGISHKDNDDGAVSILRRYDALMTTNAWYEVVRLKASDYYNYKFFGSAVSIDGDYAFVGATNRANDRGAVYVFKRSGGTWSQQAKLTASDGGSSDGFGYSISASGDYVLIGAPDINNKGAAYFFSRNGDSWSQTSKLTANDGGNNDLFGWSVSLKGDHAVIGSPRNDNENGIDAGAVYTYRPKNTGLPFLMKLISPDVHAHDQFGKSVSIGGPYTIVGAPRNDNDKGAAYVYILVNDTFAHVEKLTASDGVASDYFGHSVSVDNQYAIIGAIDDDNSNGTDAGASYIFEVAKANIEVDQSNLPEWGGGWTAMSWDQSQTFQPGLPTLTGVDIDILTANPHVGDVTITVEILESGVVVTRASKLVTVGFEGLLHFDFPTEVAVNVGETYMLHVPGTRDTFGWKYGVDTYPNGVRILGGEEEPYHDCFFQTYGIPD